MRKNKVVLILIILAILITGCISGEIVFLEENTKTKGKYGEINNYIEETKGHIDNEYMFQVTNIHNDITMVDVWVDYYDNGIFKKTVHSITSPISNDDFIHFSDKTSVVWGEKSLYLAISSSPIPLLEKDVASKVEFSENIEKSYIYTYVRIKEFEPIEPQEAIPLVIIAINKQNIINFPYSNYENMKEIIEKDMETLLKNDFVYILKCKFS